jgi:hypothetical protein
MTAVGRLDIVVDGEKWFPVTSLEACGPDDRCYAIPVDDDGVAHVVFGDGKTGRRPPRGARIEAGYHTGGGDVGNLGRRVSKRSLAGLLELIAEMVDQVDSDIQQLYADLFIETSDGRTNVLDVTDLPRALAEPDAELVVRLRVRPRRRPRHRPDK